MVGRVEALAVMKVMVAMREKLSTADGQMFLGRW